MQIKELIQYLEELAPKSMQESYDNSGLIYGNLENELKAVLISLDCTEEIVQEAIDKKCNLIISHHPIVFKGLKSLTGKNYVERTIIKAIQNDIAIYAIHTNLDNYNLGVNKKIGEILGIKNPQILSPKENLKKLTVYCPESHQDIVLKTLFAHGAGRIGNYSECSFNSSGTGTFMANDSSKPFVGNKNERHQEKEVKIEVLVTENNYNKVISEMIKAHPYEEVAYDLFSVENKNKDEGSGMFGMLDNELDTIEFLKTIKTKFKCGFIKHTAIHKKKIKKIAWCGGAGFFLLPVAKKINADIFITSDIKYHEFFDSENQIIIADIGHFESEQFTIDLLNDLISKKITTFAPCLTEVSTNPVKYL